MRQLDRAGIFKAVLREWDIKAFSTSSSVAVSIGFTITAELDGEQWADWSEYEEHSVFGDFFVLKKDGTVNQTTVDQLVAAIDWDGDLKCIAETPAPPAIEVQITVKSEEYKGKTYFKVAWINPVDFVPSAASGASAEKVEEVNARFGSLLRAAAAGSTAKRKPQPTPVQNTTPSAEPAENDLPWESEVAK